MAGDKWSVVGDGVLATEGEKAKSLLGDLSSSEGWFSYESVCMKRRLLKRVGRGCVL